MHQHEGTSSRWPIEKEGRMYKRDHDPENPTMCPITREPCMEYRCEWWRHTDPEKFESCVVWDIQYTLKSIYFSQR